MTDEECLKHAEEVANKAMAASLAGLDERQGGMGIHWAAGMPSLATVLMKEERAAAVEVTLAGLKEQRRVIVDGEE